MEDGAELVGKQAPGNGNGDSDEEISLRSRHEIAQDNAGGEHPEPGCTRCGEEDGKNSQDDESGKQCRDLRPVPDLSEQQEGERGIEPDCIEVGEPDMVDMERRERELELLLPDHSHIGQEPDAIEDQDAGNERKERGLRAGILSFMIVSELRQNRSQQIDQGKAHELVHDAHAVGQILREDKPGDGHTYDRKKGDHERLIEPRDKALPELPVDYGNKSNVRIDKGEQDRCRAF